MFLEMFNEKKTACILSASATVCALVAFVLYLAAGTNKFNLNLSTMAIVAFAVCFVCGLGIVALCAFTHDWKTIAIVSFAQYVFGLYAFLEYVVSQMNYVANIFYGVDGNVFSAAFIITLLTSLAAWILPLIVGINVHKSLRLAQKANACKIEE